MNLAVATQLGYELTAAGPGMRFDGATRAGDLVFVSGQVPSLGDVSVRGEVGAEVDLASAQKGAEICAVNCLRAALTVAQPDEIERVLKVFGMVNVADGFNDTPSVINGATDFLNSVFDDQPSHARSAVGMVLPGNWAVEIEMVIALRSS